MPHPFIIIVSIVGVLVVCSFFFPLFKEAEPAFIFPFFSPPADTPFNGTLMVTQGTEEGSNLHNYSTAPSIQVKTNWS